MRSWLRPLENMLIKKQSFFFCFLDQLVLKYNFILRIKSLCVLCIVYFSSYMVLNVFPNDVDTFPHDR